MNSADKIYDLMSDKGFQEPRTGNLFFPAYVYTYKPELEYEIRDQITQLIKKLKRPNHYLDCLVVNIYEELITFLKADSFSGSTIFDSIMEKEKEDYEDALNWILDEVDNGFYAHFEEKVKNHFKDKNDKRVFLIIYGFGTVFPYVRASDFLKKTEKLIKEFKVIVFYPGTYENSNYSLFNELNDDNLYRANHLNNQLGE
ncbi:BREX protein BrxB domain-containing protein [Winogradskyella sp. UBA3174]|uniref:BREX protein BrxB domain-containing protein n=1 Tax=Winogradskyella sp. UBA3174 TaxID=1947785 RepID=UPI0025F44138|nr:BREX protein BrxB domain-containing protein [Winogradskyella sp. UBA3174]|tara:strand:- start:128476 stop:129075 length:600 start_codon:yes stop_codon:yes gene_type:complete